MIVDSVVERKSCKSSLWWRISPTFVNGSSSHSYGVSLAGYIGNSLLPVVIGGVR